MHKRALQIAGGIAAVVTAAIVLMHLETPASVFRNYDDAAKNDAVGPGKWLPSWLPKSASEIHEAHNIDSNQVWLEFKTINSLRDLGHQCQPMDPLSAQAALPMLGRGFPRSMRKSRERLSEATKMDAVECVDADDTQKWIAVQQLGRDLIYAWTVGRAAHPLLGNTRPDQ